MRVAITGAGLVQEIDTAPEAGVDPGRLRRMDRFGRVGFLAGNEAIRARGASAHGAASARLGTIFGTAYGCRDSITDHADLVVATTRGDELRPALFAQTVHNSVNGELAIEWGLGGVSEVLVSGRCAGLEALLVAAGRIEDGEADCMVAGGAEGIHPAMQRAWAVERESYGNRGRSVDLHEAGAAVVLEKTREGVRELAAISGGTFFFEPDPEEAARRLARWVIETEDGRRGTLCVASIELEGTFSSSLWSALEGKGWESRERDTAPDRELLAAAGPAGVVEAVRRFAAADSNGNPGDEMVAVRDPQGPTALVRISAPAARRSG